MPTSLTSSRTATPSSRGRRPASRRPAGDAHLERAQLESLLLQALETEQGGLQVYDTALRCAQDGKLREEWTGYREETANHERILLQVLFRFGIEESRETPDRLVVRHIGESLVAAMEEALRSGNPGAAQLVAAECVTLAETKDHLNWSLLRHAVDGLEGDEKEALREAVDEVEDQEDEHLYHTMGWCRELWLQSLGLPATLPPPEEKRDVKSMAAAARAQKARKPTGGRKVAHKGAKKGKTRGRHVAKR